MDGLPAGAKVVVIGGGVGGASIAYHLAQRGERDVLVLERAELTSGSTFHSAGLVGQLRGSVSLTRLMMSSAELYRSLAKQPDNDPGWVECGGLRLASSQTRLDELRRQVGWARTFGLPLEEMSAEEARDLFPLMSTDGVLGATFLPTDGYLDPSQLTYALMRVARSHGVRLAERTNVVGIDVASRRDARFVVRTDAGDVQADVVVDAAGMFGAQVARMVGVRVPIVAMSHQYVVTMPVRDTADGRRLPTLRDPDLLVYFREDGAGLVMGGYERQSRPFALDGRGLDDVPRDFNGRLLPEEWPRLEEITTNAIRRVPVMADAELRKVINGPEGFTPDNEFCLGETQVRGFFVAAGFCAHGIAGAGGMGEAMAAWVLDGDPGYDLWEMDVRRFGRQYESPRYTLARVTETYESYYDIRYPGHERQAGRPLKTGPAYSWHVEHGAFFGEKSGWERVNYYLANEDPALEDLRPRGWAGINWSTAIAVEHRAARTSAALFDESSFAKLEVSGPGAVDLLEWLCDNRVARGVGRMAYTQMLNARGGVEADVTVSQLADDAFLVVTGTAFGGHDASWIRRHLPEDGSVVLRDVSGASVVFGLWGPTAHAVLQPLAGMPLDDASLPFMQWRATTVGDVPLRLHRVTFVGEHGWELHAPVEYGLALWCALWDAGRAHGLVAAGYQAIDSLRAEKGYRYWGSDVTPDESPSEVGLGWCLRQDKDYLGKQAAASRADAQRRLACVLLDDPRQVVLGNEPVRIEGRTVGRVTSGAPAYWVDASVAFAMLPAEALEPSTSVEVLVFGEWVGGQVVREPLVDPQNVRIRPRRGA